MFPAPAWWLRSWGYGVTANFYLFPNLSDRKLCLSPNVSSKALMFSAHPDLPTQRVCDEGNVSAAVRSSESSEIKPQLSPLRMWLRKQHIPSVKGRSVCQNQKPEATHFHFDLVKREALIGSLPSLRRRWCATASLASKFVSNSTTPRTDARGIFPPAALTFHRNRIFFQVGKMPPPAPPPDLLNPALQTHLFPSHFKCHLARIQILFISIPRQATW